MAPNRALPPLLLLPLLLLPLLIPQARAAADPDPDPDTPAPCHPDDLRALRAFAGNLTPAAGGPLLWPSTPSCCAWDGVACDAARRVSALRLPSRGLAGPLPSPPLAALTFLRDLDLSRNALTGAVAAVLAALPGTLRAANLSSNLLHGALPGAPRLLLPPHLEALDASNNSISGVLAPDLCAGAPKLRVLDLSANRLAGALPSSSPQPPPCAATLRELNLANNAFTGDIPAALFNLTALRKLSLAANRLTGHLTTRLADLKNLTFLDLSGNRFSGDFPDAFGGLTSLESLAAHSNAFSGPLPPSLSQLSSLRVLDLRNNSFSGPVATVNFSGMPWLASVDLATNQLNGTLPVSLAGCRVLG